MANPDTAYCMHDLDPCSCAVCNPPPGPAPVPEQWGPWFEAAWYGTCAGCGDGIHPGDAIRADGDDGYLCDDCGREDLA